MLPLLAVLFARHGSIYLLLGLFRSLSHLPVYYLLRTHRYSAFTRNPKVLGSPSPSPRASNHSSPKVYQPRAHLHHPVNSVGSPYHCQTLIHKVATMAPAAPEDAPPQWLILRSKHEREAARFQNQVSMDRIQFERDVEAQKQLLRARHANEEQGFWRRHRTNPVTTATSIATATEQAGSPTDPYTANSRLYLIPPSTVQNTDRNMLAIDPQAWKKIPTSSINSQHEGLRSPFAVANATSEIIDLCSDEEENRILPRIQNRHTTPLPLQQQTTPDSANRPNRKLLSPAPIAQPSRPVNFLDDIPDRLPTRKKYTSNVHNKETPDGTSKKESEIEVDPGTNETPSEDSFKTHFPSQLPSPVYSESLASRKSPSSSNCHQSSRGRQSVHLPVLQGQPPASLLLTPTFTEKSSTAITKKQAPRTPDRKRKKEISLSSDENASLYSPSDSDAPLLACRTRKLLRKFRANKTKSSPGSAAGSNLPQKEDRINGKNLYGFKPKHNFESSTLNPGPEKKIQKASGENVPNSENITKSLSNAQAAISPSTPMKRSTDPVKNGKKESKSTLGYSRRSAAVTAGDRIQRHYEESEELFTQDAIENDVDYEFNLSDRSRDMSITPRVVKPPTKTSFSTNKSSRGTSVFSQDGKNSKSWKEWCEQRQCGDRYVNKHTARQATVEDDNDDLDISEYVFCNGVIYHKSQKEYKNTAN